MRGHKPDNVETKIAGRSAPRWSCRQHNMDAMQERLRPAIDRLPPTVRAQKDAARGHKRSLAALLPAAGERFCAHAAQSDILDLTGLGGALNSPTALMAAGVAAAVEDDGALRPVERTLGAFSADVGAWPAGADSPPMSGALATVPLDQRRAQVAEALESALRQAPAYTAAQSANRRRRNRETGLLSGAGGHKNGVTGCANFFFRSRART